MGDDNNNNDGNGSTPSPNNNNSNKVAAQMAKMREANNKYKNLLKLAKERIQQQEDELKRLRAEAEAHEQAMEREQNAAANMMSLDDGGDTGDEQSCSIARVCQCIKVPLDGNEVNRKGGSDEIWALMEFEFFNDESNNMAMQQNNNNSNKRIKSWKRFDSESDLQDFIRRDTGEPIVLPPFSLTPEQSFQIQQEAEVSVAKITEEYRKYRVKSELARKQADAQIRDLQSNNVESTKRRIEGNQVQVALKQAQTEHSQLERLRAEMAEQEARWQEAYDVLLAENKTLKSTGSEALLASQWRQRYETCMQEKDEIENQLKIERQKANSNGDEGKYELKYRDLKESFRLYRKKAKEIFEAQQSGEEGILKLTERSEDSKLDYLKNLMVNYLTSDDAVREHMETAIGTVLQFTPEDIAKIDAKKKENEFWFYSN